MLSVAHLTLSATTAGGGIAEAVRAFAISQDHIGNKVAVVAAEDQADGLSPWPPGSPHQLASRRLPGIRYLPGLCDLLGGLDPDIVHLHGLWSWFSVETPRWARRVSRPYLVSSHGMLDHWALANAAWKKQLAARVFERRNLVGAACLHALCSPEADAIRAYGLKNPISIIPNGIDLPEDRDKGPGGTGQKSGKKILLFLGRIHPKKGLANALRAWALLKSWDEWQFVIAGWDQGGHEADLKQLCRELGLSHADVPASALVSPSPLPLLTDHCSLGTRSSVIFAGPAFGETKDELLRATSAFILPSFSEGLPMSVLEAWSYRLPVLMTDHCNLPEGFAANAAIRIGTDVKSIAEGMSDLLRAPESDLRTLGQHGRALVEQQFTWPRIAAQMKETYDWVLGGGHPPAHHL